MVRHLVVFARLPRLGVKRRLAADVGAVAAWRFYRWNADLTLRRLLGPRWRCWLALTPDRGRAPPGWGRGWRRLPQGRGDLGRRMAAVAAALPTGPVVIVGTDVPALAAAHVDSAFAALATAETVFGPAEDGGYWLIGWRRRRRFFRPFADVRWSTPHTLADTLINVPKRMPVAWLHVLSDIDDDGDAFRAWRCAPEPAGRRRVVASGHVIRGDAMR